VNLGLIFEIRRALGFGSIVLCNYADRKSELSALAISAISRRKTSGLGAFSEYDIITIFFLNSPWEFK
jgi:hypothetical protein